MVAVETALEELVAQQTAFFLPSFTRGEVLCPYLMVSLVMTASFWTRENWDLYNLF
jgi:hypothetical protein